MQSAEKAAAGGSIPPFASLFIWFIIGDKELPAHQGLFIFIYLNQYY
jgi:hypothetical protein